MLREFEMVKHRVAKIILILDRLNLFIDKADEMRKLPKACMSFEPNWLNGLTEDDAYTGLNLPHAREKPATSPENFRHLAGEGCQCKRETTYCEEHTKNV